MVTRSRAATVLAMAAAIFAPAAGLAQGVLEQMQDEVANIVSRARPSIVSIEDERIFSGQRGRPNDPGHRGPDAGKGEHGRPPTGAGAPRRPMGEPPKVGSGFSIGDGFIVTTA